MDGKFSHDVVLENIKKIRTELDEAAKAGGRSGDKVTLLAATKTVDVDTINFAIDNGITCIGENRVQELLEKYDGIRKDNVDFHFIGRLQTNKVKYIADKVSTIHSVDSYKLAAEIDKQSAKYGKVMKVFVEVNIGAEESKGGIMPEDLEEFLVSISGFKNIKVIGLMCIPPRCDSPLFEAENGLKSESTKKSYNYNAFFEKITKLFLDISQKKLDNIYMLELSMGMSDDYEQAAYYGSTVVRVGRGLFGSRN